MKLSKAYTDVSGDTEELADLFYDEKIDTVVGKISVFIGFLDGKYKLLSAYQSYSEYAQKMFCSNDYYSKLHREIVEYISTLSIDYLLDAHANGICEDEIADVIIPRVVKDINIIDTVRSRELKSQLILMVMFDNNINLDALKLKTIGLTPPETVSSRYDWDEHHILWYLDWISSTKCDYVEHLSRLKCEIDNEFLLAYVHKLFSPKITIIVFSLDYPEDNILEKLINLVFDKLTVQDFLEIIYDADKKYSSIETGRLEKIYFEFREYSDV